MKPTHRLPILVFLSGLIALVFSAIATAAEAQTAPVVVTANPGQTITFTVASVQGTAPFAYAFYKNGQQITASVGNAYAINSAGPTDAGVYYFLISNSAGQLLTAPLVVAIAPSLPAPPAVPLPPTNPSVTSAVK